MNTNTNQPSVYIECDNGMKKCGPIATDDLIIDNQSSTACNIFKQKQRGCKESSKCKQVKALENAY